MLKKVCFVFNRKPWYNYGYVSLSCRYNWNLTCLIKFIISFEKNSMFVTSYYKFENFTCLCVLLVSPTMSCFLWFEMFIKFLNWSIALWLRLNEVREFCKHKAEAKLCSISLKPKACEEIYLPSRSEAKDTSSTLTSFPVLTKAITKKYLFFKAYKNKFELNFVRPRSLV